MGAREKRLIVAIDPGPHTGLAMWDGDTFQFGTLDFLALKIQNGMDAPHRHLDNWLDANTIADDIIICEKFEYQKEKAKDREHLNFDAAEYVGVVKLFAQRNPSVQLVMQSPSMAVGQKAFWTDTKLKRLKLWKPGRHNRHEMDALRHLLYYVTFKLNDNQFIWRLQNG